MFIYSHNGITIASMLDTRRGTKGGKFPVKIRVTFSRDRKYYSTGKSLSIDEWEKLPITKSRAFSEIKSDIQISFDKVKDIIQALEAESSFSFEALNSRLGKCMNDSMNSAFKAKIKSLEIEGRAGTQVYYNCALTSIEKFAGENIQFVAINVDWLKRYEKSMLKKGCSYTTIGMYLRALRALMNDAKREDVIKESQYPFGKGKYEIPTGLGRKLALTLSQIKSIVNYTGNPVTEKYRDLWFFSYLCNGINFTDLIQLKYSNIQNGEISFLRAKTIRTSKVKKEIQATLTPEIKKIIKRWGNPGRRPDQYIFPYLKGQETPMEVRAIAQDIIHRTNDRLKEIGKALKIDHLSTYSARHSFATVLKRSGANIAYISESLGHADQKTTENYLASFEKDERIKNAALLTKF
jgi:integrase/recombinase XerD